MKTINLLHPLSYRSSVTIGICSYASETDSKNIIDQLLAQSESEDVAVSQILVLCDSSPAIVRGLAQKYNDKRVKFIQFPAQERKAARMNYILRNCNSDILIFAHQDIVLKSKKVILNLTAPFIKDSTVGLAGARLLPLKAETVIEGAIHGSVTARLAVEHVFDFSTRAYGVDGKMIALSQAFMKDITIPHSVLLEGAYLYFRAIQKGYEIRFAGHSTAYYRSPQTIRDVYAELVNQYEGIFQLSQIFPRVVVESGYHMPFDVKLRIAFYQLLTNPAAFLLTQSIAHVARFTAKTHQKQIESVQPRYRKRRYA